METVPQLGSQLAGYRIDRLIGRGGMGVVYEAEQLRLHRRVALKVVAPELADDPDFRERFERESELAASLDHPNVITVYEAGESEGVLFISMRYVDGLDLRQVLNRERRLEPRRGAAIVAQMAAALDAAHELGLVHRDVKPGNALLSSARGEEHVFLSDFGLTKHMASHSGLTHTGQFVGTLDYVAPEQLTGGHIDARVDVYALGCVLFEVLTGDVPYERESDAAKIYAHLELPPPSVSLADPAATSGFDAVIGRALAKSPEDRYPSAGELGRAAVAASEGVPVPTVPAPGATQAAPPPPPPPPPVSQPTDPLPASPPTPQQPYPQPYQPPASPPRRSGVPVWVWALGGALVLAAAIAAVIVLVVAKPTHSAPASSRAPSSSGVSGTSQPSQPSRRAYVGQVDSLLRQSAPFKQQVSTLFQQIQAGSIGLTDANSGLSSVISNRSSLRATAQSLNAPDAQTAAVRQALVDSFSASLEDDREIQNCLNAGAQTGLADVLNGCLSSTSNASDAATAAKQHFLSLYNPLRASQGLPASNIDF